MLMDSLPIELAEYLSRYPEIRLAILFGSLAHGDAKPESDLDLAVLCDRPIPVSKKYAWMADLAERFGRPVDLVDLKTVGEPLLGQVFKGRKILGDNTTYAQLLSRHLVDAEDFLPLRQRILEERRQAWTG